MSNFAVFVLDRHGNVTNVCRFGAKEVPATLEDFWRSTGIDGRIVQGKNFRVTVNTKAGWEKLGAYARPMYAYKTDPNDGVQFQLSPYSTPSSSPDTEALKGRGGEKIGVNFESVVANLLPDNPFAGRIPSIYEDNTITSLRAFFRQRSAEQEGADIPVLALILAMPGSGKTRSVVEATRMEKTRCKRLRMSQYEFHSADSLKKFLSAKVVQACGVKSMPSVFNEVVVVHLDEIQSLMSAPEGSQELLVTTLSTEIDCLINADPPRWWLKFVLTGTNVFTRSTIKIKTEVKIDPITLDGSFSIDFVQQLADDHGLSGSFAGTNYLERCRHNRRFTELFLKEVWKGIYESKGAGFDVADAYDDAFLIMKEQMSNQIEHFAPVSRVACSVFAKILAVPRGKVDRFLRLSNCSHDENAYIAGGGFNVRAIDNDSITIYNPAGFVLEVLEALLGRAAPYATGSTVTSFLRVHSVCGFGVKGHLFEWLIAHDILCPQSEFDGVMEPYASRHDNCIGAEAISGAKVYDLIFDADAVPGIWVVRDTHLNNQDRWVDVAYSIKVSGDYTKGFALLECKTGYKKARQALRNSCEKFFTKAAKFAQSHSSYYFVAVFVSECEFENEDVSALPQNLTTVTQVITNERCPMIASFLAADPTDSGSNEALAEELSRAAVVSDVGAKSYLGGSQGM